MYRRHLKRPLEFLIAGIAFLALSPLLLYLCAIIRIDSAGSPFFLQDRIGRNFRVFHLIKLRSMTEKKDASRGGFTPGDGRRVTRVGKWLRKTKVDELPQLLNVIKGDMGIVGPRPEVSEYVFKYPRKFEKILTVRPGLTDYASVRYRNEEELLLGRSNPQQYYQDIILPEKLHLAGYYVEKISLGTDMEIVTQTLSRLFLSRSATPPDRTELSPCWKPRHRRTDP